MIPIEIIAGFGVPDWYRREDYEGDPAASAGGKLSCYIPETDRSRDLKARMTRAADAFAQARGSIAINPVGLLMAIYDAGHFDPPHIDQYEGRAEPDMIDRTVSASLIVEKAEAGGDMIFQDFNKRREPIRIKPDPGTLILFGGDTWHQVEKVTKGHRRAIICWWSNGTGERYKSPEYPAPVI